LLTEHYGIFAGGLDDDEVDDTDPTQKDFLFGALLREMGTIARHDTLLNTLRLGAEVAASRVKWFYRLAVRPPIALYERFLSGPAAKVGDAYVALNGGFHHLVQYLCFLRNSDETLLTARANVPRLVETSHEMRARLERDEETALERHTFRATPRYRVVWLTRLFHAPLAPRSFRLMRALATVGLTAVVAVVLVRFVSSAIAYHPAYVARMKSQAARSTSGEHAP
jgi:hypothetical protein